MKPPARPRRSSCAAQSLNHELTRLRRMSIEDRIKAALSMDARFSWLQPTAIKRS
jgi:hypothetical protein